MTTAPAGPEASAPPGTPQAQQRDSPRAAILAAARELLARGGAAGLTMRALARSVGVSAPTIYSHFPGKAALIEELADEAGRALAAALREARTLPGATPLAAVLSAYWRFADQHPALFDLIFLAANGLPLPAPGIAQEFQLALGGEHSLDRALAAWAFAHGWVALARSGHLPAGADREAVASNLLALAGRQALAGPAGPTP